jgi:hypothetical protein
MKSGNRGVTLKSHKNSVLHLSDLKSERSLTASFGAIFPVVDGGSLNQNRSSPGSAGEAAKV